MSTPSLEFEFCFFCGGRGLRQTFVTRTNPTGEEPCLMCRGTGYGKSLETLQREANERYERDVFPAGYVRMTPEELDKPLPVGTKVRRVTGTVTTWVMCSKIGQVVEPQYRDQDFARPETP